MLLFAEMTVPWEVGKKEAHQGKLKRYGELAAEVWERVIVYTVLPLEVGCPGLFTLEG